MSAIERLTITVPAEMAATVRLAGDAGDYASTSEVVREALRDWVRQHDVERRELETLREAIRVGLASGPGVPADEVYAGLHALISERRAGQG